ncbi:hypothetical protein V7S57_02285 [Caulobacter sp. CCNWLY153]|uniref:hypothetical protein n=1 Tax=unclassified Caulobacter TaxID=2648921 RepID=UPI002FF018AB
MRTHTDIIADAGGPTRLARSISTTAAVVDAGLVAAWKREESIPPAYWPRIVAAEIATLEELAHAAEARKFPALAAERAAAQVAA